MLATTPSLPPKRLPNVALQFWPGFPSSFTGTQRFSRARPNSVIWFAVKPTSGV